MRACSDGLWKKAANCQRSAIAPDRTSRITGREWRLKILKMKRAL